jgi:uncharacterized membrane protein
MKRTKTEALGERRDIRGIKIEKTVRVNKSPAVLYSFWRNLENLPRFMDHLESVKMTSPYVSHWVGKGPAGKSLEWDAEIIAETPDELISWQSLEGSDVHHSGSVRFIQTAPNQTEIRVMMAYDPPGHRLGAAVAKLLGEDPATQIEHDLLQLKDLLESGSA